MVSLQEFESSLKEVVLAKRLSASKMESLTEVALKLTDQDAKLLSVLFHTHMNIPASSKVSSLYVFDSICRAARRQTIKHNLTTDGDKGNAATFLLKTQRILEGLFQDIIASNPSEGKEKAKKVLDIWSKGNTFPLFVLTRLKELVSDNEKEPDRVIDQIKTQTSDPHLSTLLTTPVPATTAAPPATDPQSTLLALLAQAASSNTNNTTTLQTSPNTTSLPNSELSALAVLQQLTQTATLGNNNPPPAAAPAPPPSYPPSNVPRDPRLNRSSYPPPAQSRHESYDQPSRHNSRYDSRSPDRNYGDNYHNSRGSYPRGGYRGNFRGRGRERGRWDDHDREHRDRYRERSPLARRRSRSPSPRRYGFQQNTVRPYSPPRRAPAFAPAPMVALPSNTAVDASRDEFGRDARPGSPANSDPRERDTDSRVRMLPPEAATSVSGNTSSVSAPDGGVISDLNPTVVAASAASSTGVPAVPHLGGIENFDLSTFDFSQASSWEMLGNMWQTTYGSKPSAEELMQFVMSGGQVSMPVVQGTISAWSSWDAPGERDQQGWNPSYRGYGRGRGRGGNRGGYSYGNSRGSYGGYGSAGKDTDAIVLGGGDAPSSDSAGGGLDYGDDEAPTTHAPASAGKMQKVGDKWIFVQGTSVQS